MMRNQSVYFPGLNGLRAIAALSVVISHITLKLDHFGLNPHIFGSTTGDKPRGLELAGYGVTIFFVLSGFLITYLLIKEKEAGTISIGKFYLRRILRIWPLYYAYLAIVIIVNVSIGNPLDAGTLLLYIFYAANVPYILSNTLPMVEHYWSLGVEEQFYLFWPWIMKKVDRWIMPVTVGLIVLLIGARLVIHFVFPNVILERALQVTRFHSLLIGALAAMLYFRRHALFLQLTDNKLVQVLCWLMLGVILVGKFHVASIIDDDLVAMMAVCLIMGQVNVRNRVVNLELNAMDFLGKISYGIYVIHPVLIFLFYRLFPSIPLPSPVSYIVIYVVITAITILLAWLSYNYFEKYFLKLKSKFVVVKSSASKAQAQASE
jgi:peptidoglycan/LPS O-acetylase OafA/YrhL